MTTAAMTAPASPAAPAAPAGRRRSSLGLMAHQVRYEQLSFWRNPQSAVFTFIFPVVFITIIGALFRGTSPSSFYDGRTVLGYYVPTIAAVSILGSCYGQLAVALAARRQNGMLKRARATPLPAWAYFAGLLVHCLLVSLADVVLILGVARAYGLALPAHWAAVAVTLVLGAASFCALGVAVASVIANAEAAPAVAQLALFPLLFLSGTYMPIHSSLLNQVTAWLPVRPFNQALLAAFGQQGGSGWPGWLGGSGGPGWQHLGVLLAWGAVGSVIAIRRFRWNPRPE